MSIFLKLQYNKYVIITQHFTCTNNGFKVELLTCILFDSMFPQMYILTTNSYTHCLKYSDVLNPTDA